MTATITKATLEARIAELEAQLAAVAQPQPTGMIRLVGLVKAVKDISAKGVAAATGILVNSTDELINGDTIKVDLPVDGFYARDKEPGGVASALLDLSNSTLWARVALEGYWKVANPAMNITKNDRGYYVAQRRELRVMKVEVLGAQFHQQDETSLPPIDRSRQEQFAPF